MTVIDPLRALQYADGDADFANQMLADLQSKLLELRALNPEGKVDSQVPEVARLAHRLVGVAGMVGADLIVESARAVAWAHRQHGCVNAQLLDDFFRILNQTLDELQR
jgi:HPt (histidine-containing phosphotransfer) domain-containing protein